MYTVTTPQLIFATVLSALIAAGSIVAYTQFKEQQGRQTLPEVQLTLEGNCSKVINFRNGDAYNCEDVDVLLRDYNTTQAQPGPKAKNESVVS